MEFAERDFFSGEVVKQVQGGKAKVTDVSFFDNVALAHDGEQDGLGEAADLAKFSGSFVVHF